MPVEPLTGPGRHLPVQTAPPVRGKPPLPEKRDAPHAARGCTGPGRGSPPLRQRPPHISARTVPRADSPRTHAWSMGGTARTAPLPARAGTVWPPLPHEPPRSGRPRSRGGGGRRTAARCRARPPEPRPGAPRFPHPPCLGPSPVAQGPVVAPAAGWAPPPLRVAARTSERPSGRCRCRSGRRWRVCRPRPGRCRPAAPAAPGPAGRPGRSPRRWGTPTAGPRSGSDAGTRPGRVGRSTGRWWCRCGRAWAPTADYRPGPETVNGTLLRAERTHNLSGVAPGEDQSRKPGGNRLTRGQERQGLGHRRPARRRATRGRLGETHRACGRARLGSAAPPRAGQGRAGQGRAGQRRASVVPQALGRYSDPGGRVPWPSVRVRAANDRVQGQ